MPATTGSPMPRRTGRSLTDPDVLMAELARIRERNYSTDNEEFMDDMTAVALLAAGLVTGLVYGAATGDIGATLPTVLGTAAAQLPAVWLPAAVAADEGWAFVRADLGQVEPRVLAAVSRDEAFAAARAIVDRARPH